MLAFVGGIAIGFGVSWLLLPFRSQAEPGASSEWPPMLGASDLTKLSLAGDKAMRKLNHEKARFIAEQWRERAKQVSGADN